MASPQQPPPPPPPTLRVMRLYRPSAPRPGSSALILPESFGNIYAGEPFVAYVAVTNGGPRPLRDVLVTAKLQAPSAKRAVDLPDTFASKRDAAEAAGLDVDGWRTSDVPRPNDAVAENPASLLEEHRHTEQIVEKTLDEVGTHTLRVSVAYRGDGDAPDAEPRSLRKFYRFNVLAPLQIRTAAWLLPRPPPGVFDDDEPELLGVVECDIENLAHDTCHLIATVLRPPQGFQSREPAPSPPEEGVPLKSDGIDVMPAGGRCRRLFVVSRVRASSFLTGEAPDHDLDPPAYPARAGVVRVAWRVGDGEGGATATSPIDWAPRPGAGDARPNTERRRPADARDTDRMKIRVEVRGLPAQLQLNEEYEATCVVVNRLAEPRNLQLQWRMKDMPPGVLAAGKIYTNIGKVAGRSRTNITQKFFAQQTGMWQLTGCAVVELDTDEEWVMPNLLDVVVAETGVSTPLPAVPERSNSTVFTREASPKPSQPDVFASPSEDRPPSTNSSASNLLDMSSAGIAAQEAVFAAPPPADRLYVDVTTTPPPGAVDTGAGLPSEPATPPPADTPPPPPPDISRAPMPSPDPLLRPPEPRAAPPPPPPTGDAFDLFGSDIADHSFMAESAVSEISAVSPVPTPPRTLPAPPFAAPPIPEGQTIIPPAAAAPPQTPPAAAADLFPDDPLSGGGFGAAPAPAAADLFGPAPT